MRPKRSPSVAASDRGRIFLVSSLAALSITAAAPLRQPGLNDRFMIRILFIALAFTVLTLVLLPFQVVGIAFNLPLQRTIPHLYHRILCKLIGVRITEVGRRSAAS